MLFASSNEDISCATCRVCPVHLPRTGASECSGIHLSHFETTDQPAYHVQVRCPRVPDTLYGKVHEHIRI